MLLTPPNMPVFASIPPAVEKTGKAVLDAAYRIHGALGPGLTVNAYASLLAYELKESGLAVESRVAVPVVYKELRLEEALTLDLLVEKCVVVAVKTVEALTPLHEAELLTGLRLSGVQLGFLMNFSVLHLKDGIKRLVL